MKITEWQKNTVSKYTELTRYYYSELMLDKNSRLLIRVKQISELYKK